MPKRGAKCAYPATVWDFPRQAFTSANTSRKQLPALMGKETAPYVQYKRGTKNADIGGGRFDLGTQALKKKGVKNFVYDPLEPLRRPQRGRRQGHPLRPSPHRDRLQRAERHQGARSPPEGHPAGR